MKLEKFQKDMAVFSFRQHQDVLTYLAQLKIKGWTIEDAKQWIEQEKEQRTEESQFSRNYLCPVCKTLMRLLLVNTNKANQTGDNSKTVWLCSKPKCLYTEYSTKTVREWMKELKKGGT